MLPLQQFRESETLIVGRSEHRTSNTEPSTLNPSAFASGSGATSNLHRAETQ
jgi:hypothetical protein